MICAVSVALAMLEWIRTSYLSPNAAKRLPVNSACSRPGSGDTFEQMTGLSETGKIQGKQQRFFLQELLSRVVHYMHAVTLSELTHHTLNLVPCTSDCLKLLSRLDVRGSKDLME